MTTINQFQLQENKKNTHNPKYSGLWSMLKHILDYIHIKSILNVNKMKTNLYDNNMDNEWTTLSSRSIYK